jgi:methionine-rich copper-binding protein CopC
MKSLTVFAIVIAGLVSACTYRHETVERPAPAATAVVTPVPASNTVVYTEPAPAASTTTVYTR